MIAQLTGRVIEQQIPTLVIDTGSIAYEVEATVGVFSMITDDKDITIQTHLQVREDAHVLYGFASSDEKHMFRSLIKVSGIGPKSALLMLSGMSPDSLVSAILEEDVSALVKLPGIGKKTAERLIIELRDKLDKLSLATTPIDKRQIGVSALKVSKGDAVDALISLGYKAVEAEKMVDQVYQDDMNTETLIRVALKAKLGR